MPNQHDVRVPDDARNPYTDTLEGLTAEDGAAAIRLTALFLDYPIHEGTGQVFRMLRVAISAPLVDFELQFADKPFLRLVNYVPVENSNEFGFQIFAEGFDITLVPEGISRAELKSGVLTIEMGDGDHIALICDGGA